MVLDILMERTCPQQKAQAPPRTGPLASIRAHSWTESLFVLLRVLRGQTG